MTGPVRFEQVSKSYRVGGGRKVLFEALDMDLPDCNVGLLGGNGSGKSTLLRLVSGAERPDRGRILCKGRVSWPLGFAASFNGSMTGAENARFVARIYGEDVRRVTAFAEDFAELGAFFRMPVASFSSGMRARLAFALSMAIAFDIYLVDEITEVGDQRFKERCRAHFKEKLANSRLIMVSHNMASLRSYCDAGLVLSDGRARLFDRLEDAIAVHQRGMTMQSPA